MREAPGASVGQNELSQTEPNVAEDEAATPGAGQGASAPDEALKQAERTAQEHYDAWMRAKAEADNIRKRAQVEIASAHKFALENFAGDLLAVRDSLEAALATDTATVESMRSGVEITLKQLAAVFDRFHVTEVNPLGQRFDPHRHQAIGTEESDAEPNTVLKVLQKGYLLHERVIRPALVIVAKAKG